MTLPQRQVHHLRVAASSVDAARAVLPRLEDALRCASLPDAGGRLLLVRRLVLGRLDRGASAQAIARRIEACMLDTPGQWVDGAAVDDGPAERVCFASALQARALLAVRLLRGQSVTAWYWPRAVPEFRAVIAPSADVAAIAGTLARSEQAAALLPAWCAQVCDRTGPQALLLALPAALGQACCAAAGLPRADPPSTWLELLLQAAPGGATVAPWAPRGGPVDHAAADVAQPGRAAPVASRPALPEATLPQSLRGALPSSPLPPPSEELAKPAPSQAAGPRADAVQAPAVADAGGRARPPAAPPRPAPLLQPSPGAPGALPAHPAPPAADHVTAGLPAQPGPTPDLAPAGPAPAGTDLPAPSGLPWLGLLATPLGGLLFLLPVLQRLGLPAWAEQGGASPAAWTAAVLQQALLRLAAPPADPAWAPLLQRLPLLPPGRLDSAAPNCWQAAALQAPRGRPQLPLPQALDQAATAQAQAALWLTAARRWLRRGPHIGLASLVRRPAWVGLTATHADVFQALGAADVRVRRAGLDIDPGWLPWFGRVVAYHYVAMPELGP
ncbi:hypothetical protein BurJ1DRAFT_2327 [Burkholderiales bacterium JOSHI_001]|nr:hypothetical protein BurJ1DRAFT_2327 [Burkholderiales bacterium JOSHI_001]